MDDAGEPRPDEVCPQCAKTGAHARSTGIWSNQPYAADSTVWTLRCDACAHEWEVVSRPGE